MSGYDSSDDDDDDDDVVLLVCVMDSVIGKIRRQSRVPKHVSSFSGHEKMCELTTGHEGLLLEHIRMNRDCFHRLVTLFTVQNRLQETHTLTVQEQLMMFLTMVAHVDINRRTSYEWKHSGETVSRYIDTISSHLVQLASRFIVPPDFNDVSTVIAKNQRFFPYFQGCVGAIDGTHIPCVVDSDVAAAYRNRKGFTSQNVMAVVDFEMKFTYLVAGWEGSCHDARVLNVATSNPAFMFPHAPEGKYYLVDAGYKNKPGFLAPFRGQNYHLHDRRREDSDRRKEMFNFRHASLRKSSSEHLEYIVIACAVLHNFIKLFSSEDAAFNPEDDAVDDGNAEDDVGEASTQQQREESNDMGHIRDHIANAMWNDRLD
ncbi:hypothetical protein UlMin_020102 [Ulmus minor]